MRSLQASTHALACTMHSFALLLHIATVDSTHEVIAYLGDPQIGFSGNETEDTIRAA